MGDGKASAMPEAVFFFSIIALGKYTRSSLLVATLQQKLFTWARSVVYPLDGQSNWNRMNAWIISSHILRNSVPGSRLKAQHFRKQLSNILVTHPSSIVTLSMITELAILTFSLIVHEAPMIDRLIEDFSATSVKLPIMQSAPTFVEEIYIYNVKVKMQGRVTT